ncbi:predicted protein [Phaeodactylum tricornutum CCAP 1055/1]|uniref:Ubiquitin-like domain-containing protein n=3 Tax=Phaeodactylum tricornutum TaxID=2850 RepID=B7GCB4_PHATC|nr:predicted protein [Phaeodactylum tricornutum CCAP 1055/1]EEC43835.1 predicted protein [Phaeodactylum tricornutum CCAP 1055/1]|eukprot:XP_002184776.1 predicted protein [Phaeodactylum tricornutum CCAP 1055/1]
MSSSSAVDITVTLVSTASGQSESFPLSPSTTIAELLDWAKALFGVDGNVRLYKDGKLLSNPSSSLKAAGIVNGDLIAAQSAIAALPSAPPPTASTPAGSGGLDFSNLFAAQSAGSTNAASASLLSEVAPAPSYYPGMSLSDAVAHNPHPHTFVSLLFSKEHLRKELNYHNPRLAVRLESQSLEEAVRIWREEMVKGGIQKAVQNSSHYHIEQDMKRRLTPFLHEKDLAEAQGGTKGFDPQKSNEEFLRRQREESEDDPSMKD